MMIFTVISIVLGFLICSLGLKGGVEKITKWMMLALLVIIAILVVNSLTLPGAKAGLKYYLVPSLEPIREHGLGEVVFAALGQAFFTLSIGMGSMAIFGTYIGKDRALLGESISIAALDTFVAIASGLIIIPACFSFGIDLGSGPSLVFETLPNVFNHMAGGRIWGSLFFVFMIFAAMSTVVGVFENIIAFFMDTYGWSRRRACAVNCIAMIVLSVPCVLGFNLLSFITPLGAGSNIMDLEDFIVSNNILPIGSIIYVLFCTSKRFGWGWDNFLEEVNTGKGIKFPKWLRVYMTYVLPAVVVFLLVQGYIAKF
jgi:NSS family neurotransmitter:Na+ symporter